MGVVSGGGGGGGTGAVGGLNRLFDSTLTQAASSIDTGANGVSQAYKHLLFMIRVGSSKSAASDTLAVTVNADSAAHYNWTLYNTHGSTPGGAEGNASAPSGVLTWVIPAATSTNTSGSLVFYLPDYTATSTNMIAVGLGGYQATAGNHQVQMSQMLWTGNAPVSQVAFAAAGGNLIAGTRVTIYGLG